MSLSRCTTLWHLSLHHCYYQQTDSLKSQISYPNLEQKIRNISLKSQINYPNLKRTMYKSSYNQNYKAFQFTMMHNSLILIVATMAQSTNKPSFCEVCRYRSNFCKTPKYENMIRFPHFITSIQSKSPKNRPRKSI